MLAQTHTMRCAIYGRQANENDAPIERQVASCLATVEQLSGENIDAHRFIDTGKAARGAPGIRKELQRLMALASKQPPAIDVVIVDEPHRFSRRVREMLDVFSRLSRLGVRVVVANAAQQNGFKRA